MDIENNIKNKLKDLYDSLEKLEDASYRGYIVSYSKIENILIKIEALESIIK